MRKLPTLLLGLSLFIVAGASLVATPASAAVDAFVAIDGVEGESTQKDHKDWLDVTALDIGSQSSGAGAGKVTFNPFSITRKIDKASPGIARACASGKHIPKVVIELSGENQHQIVWRVVLQNVLVSAYRALPQANGRAAPVHEEMTLAHGGVELWSRAVLPNGALGEWVKRDFAASKHELPVSVGGGAAAPLPPAAR